MLMSLIKRFKHFLVTMRFSILFIFISLFILSMMTLITMTYFHFTKTMLDISYKLMDNISNVVYENVNSDIKEAESIGNLSSSLMQFGIIPYNNFIEINEYLYHLLREETPHVPTIQRIGWGNTSGDYIISERLNDGTIRSRELIRSIKPETYTFTYRDIKGNVIKKELSDNFTFDPRQRRWYVFAQNTGSPVWSNLFRFLTGGDFGVALAIPVFIKNEFQGVFGIFLQLNTLQKFIENIHVSQQGLVFIIREDGNIIAYPGLKQRTIVNINDIQNPWVITAFNLFKESNKNIFQFKINNKIYLAVFKPITMLNKNDWFVGVVAPEEDFVGQFIKSNMLTLGISFLILIVGIILVSYFVSLVVKPLKVITREIEHIEHFELEKGVDVRSRIKEIILMSKALEAMKQGLRSFKKYVPATLVKQLIETGQDVYAGGTKKPLAILFSDIRNFTMISESYDPDKLTHHLCEYFTELSEIISSERGTIDKYIGDSIMAFWGAPLPEESPCQQAAKAALLCQKRLAELNQRWMSEGKPVMATGIGIHMGDAIVGNFGSPQRLNYTIIGDAVNTTSRLESCNKIYYTQIIVSEDVYDILKDQFVFRLLDYVTLKGKVKKNNIYELMAFTQDELSFDIHLYRSYFEKGFHAYKKQQWDQAIGFFSEAIRVFTNDTVAPIFIQRCKEFKGHPPQKLWDGAWVI